MEERVHYAIIRTVDATEGRLGVGGRSCCSLLQCCLDRGRGGVAALCSRSGEGDGYAVCVCAVRRDFVKLFGLNASHFLRCEGCFVTSVSFRRLT